MLPVEIASRPDLTGTAKVVFCSIADRAGANGESWPGMRRLAKDCGCGLNAVKAAIANLESAGLIAVDRPTGNPAWQTNRYRILDACPKPTRSAKQHVAQSARATCPKAPALRVQKRYITRPIEPDPLNQSKTPPTPPGGKGAEDVPIEEIIGLASEDGPIGAPYGPAESPETIAGLPKAVWDALVRYKGSPAAVSANLKNRAIKHTDAYDAERVVKALDKLKAEGKPWAALGPMLAADQRQEYDHGKPSGSNVDAAETRRAAQRATEHPAEDRPPPRVDFTTAGSP